MIFGLIINLILFVKNIEIAVKHWKYKVKFKVKQLYCVS